MCSTEEKIQLVKENKVFVFTKAKFYITTGISLIIILCSFIVNFTTVRLQANETRNLVDAHSLDIKNLQADRDYFIEFRFNLERLCESQGINYIRLDNMPSNK